jgi:chemotaxis protein histidine kinase CheA
MKKRAKELGGEMNIKTKPNKGTTIILKVPLDLLQAPHSTYKTSN